MNWWCLLTVVFRVDWDLDELFPVFTTFLLSTAVFSSEFMLNIKRNFHVLLSFSTSPHVSSVQSRDISLFLVVFYALLTPHAFMRHPIWVGHSFPLLMMNTDSLVISTTQKRQPVPLRYTLDQKLLFTIFKLLRTRQLNFLCSRPKISSPNFKYRVTEQFFSFISLHSVLSDLPSKIRVCCISRGGCRADENKDVWQVRNSVRSKCRVSTEGKWQLWDTLSGGVLCSFPLHRQFDSQTKVGAFKNPKSNSTVPTGAL